LGSKRGAPPTPGNVYGMKREGEKGKGSGGPAVMGDPRGAHVLWPSEEEGVCWEGGGGGGGGGT